MKKFISQITTVGLKVYFGYYCVTLSFAEKPQIGISHTK